MMADLLIVIAVVPFPFLKGIFAHLRISVLRDWLCIQVDVWRVSLCGGEGGLLSGFLRLDAL